MKIAQTFIVAAALAVALGCGYSKSNTPPAPGNVPTIAQLNPTSAISGGADFVLEVDGTQFAADAAINFNGAKQATTFVNNTKLTATIPAAAILNPGAVPVTVTNPGKSGGVYGGGTLPETSTPMNFTIN